MRLADALIIAWLGAATDASAQQLAAEPRTDRIRRMIRSGAQIPPDQIPLMAEYLAKALPERPRPPPPGKHGQSPHTPKR